MHDIKYYQSVTREDFVDKQESLKLFDAIDDMWHCRWELPEGLAGKKWMRKFVTTAPRDAMMASARVFSARSPFISVQPLSPDSRDLAESQERFLEWQIKKIKKRSSTDPIFDILLSAVKYSAVAYQVVYLPFQFKGRENDARMKAIKRQGDFSFIVHDPRTVFPRYNPYMLESVKKIDIRNAQQIVDEFGKDNPGVKELIAKVKLEKDKDMALEAALLKRKLTFIDYTDYDVRAVWVSLERTDSVVDTEMGGKDPIVLILKEHKMPFINWVYKKDDNPLMKPVIDADLYNNANVLESLRYFLVISTVAQAKAWSKTLNKDGVEVDFTEPSSQVKLGLNEDFGMLPPSQLDPNINLLIDSVRGDIRKSTVAESLTTIERLASGTPFSSVNAIIQASVASLAPLKKISEAALEDGLIKMFEWIKYSDIPSIAYRDKNKSIDYKEDMAGSQIAIMPDEIEPSEMEISVDLQADTPTDKQGKIDMAVRMSTELMVAPRRAMEENGLEYSDSDLEEYLQSKYLNAEQEADIKRILGKVDLEMQAATMQMQMQQQQAQMQQQQQQMQQQQMAEQGAVAEEAAMGGGGSPMGGPPGGASGRPEGNPPIQRGAPTREQSTNTAPNGQQIGGA